VMSDAGPVLVITASRERPGEESAILYQTRGDAWDADVAQRRADLAWMASAVNSAETGSVKLSGGELVFKKFGEAITGIPGMIADGGISLARMFESAFTGTFEASMNGIASIMGLKGTPYPAAEGYGAGYMAGTRAIGADQTTALYAGANLFGGSEVFPVGSFGPERPLDPQLTALPGFSKGNDAAGVTAIGLGVVAGKGLGALEAGGGLNAERAVAINGAPRSVPLGFQSESHFLNAADELYSALRASGIDDAVIGVRGSSVTGQSWRTGKPFGAKSDIDFFIESSRLTDGYLTSPNIPGFVNPKPILRDYPLLRDWSNKWQIDLGRKITPGGFVPGTVPSQPAILIRN